MESLTRREREKLVREEEIISAAAKIFYQKGFDDASMEQIAKEAQFTIRTLYKYFECKEDLYFSVVLKEFKRLFSYLEKASDNNQSGYMKVQTAGEYFYKFYKEKPETFRILNYLGYVKKKSKESKSKKRNDFMQLNNDIFQLTTKMILEGKADGSITNNLGAEKIAFSLIFLLTAFFNQLSVVGNDFTENFSLDIEDFSRSTLDLILDTLNKNQVS